MGSQPHMHLFFSYTQKRLRSTERNSGRLDSDLQTMGSWVRTITTPFRKMLNPQRDQQHGKKASRHRRKSSGVTAARGGELERTTSSSSQLQGEVMACAYEDVQVMWSMLDKSRICSAAAS